MNKIQLEWRDRPGSGAGSQCRCQALIIDQHSLSDLVNRELSSTLGWFVKEHDVLSRRRLLGLEPPDMHNGRVSLLVCSSCGELVCGAVGAIIERVDKGVVWRDFAFEQGENSYSEPMPEIGPFRFEATQYEREITGGMRLSA